MPDTLSVSEQVSAAVDSAVAKHSESPSQDGDQTSADGSPAGKTPAPAGASGSEASSAGDASQDARDGATRQPGDTDDDDVKDDSKWKELESRRSILKNARTKGASEFQRGLEQRLGFSLSDENTVQNLRLFVSDPAGYLQRYAQHFGLAPNAEPPKAPANTAGFQRPSPRLAAEDGTPAYAQAEVDALVDHLNGQIEELKRSLNPIQQTHQQFEQQRVWSQAMSEADRTYKEISSWEGFDDVKDRMLELMKTDGRVTYESAYRRAYQEIYRPKLEQTVRQKALDDLKKAPAVTPKVVTPNAQARAGASSKRGNLSVAEAIEFAVEKHSA